MKKVSKIVILLVTSLTLAGCFNYKEINDYAIVSGISIDIDKKNISSTRPYMPYFTGFRRHLIATINGLSINKEYIR